MRRFFIASLAVFALALAAHAQDARDMNDEARTRYAKSLKDATALVQQKRFDAAKSALDALIAQRPREPQARFLLGIVQTESGDDAAAAKTFTDLTQEYPELPEPHNNLAVLYAKRGNVDGARVELETALKAAPDWAVAHENLGDLYARMAADQYEHATKLDRLNKTAAAKLTIARNLLSTSADSKPDSKQDSKQDSSPSASK
jgi:Flp pilus assembly protein TadD